MYFSLEPKTKREDLYNREKELKELENALKDSRITLLIGIRRIGKTSLLRVFLEEKKKKNYPFIFIDCRSFTTGNTINKSELNIYILDALQKTLKENVFKKLLRSVSNIKVSWFEINFNKKSKNQPTLAQALDDLNIILRKAERKLIIAIDEAQNLRFYGRGGIEFLNLIARTYDYLESIQFILTGSEVGILHDFLKKDDPKSSLFGRYIKEIKLGRFSKEDSINFLFKGFKQINIKLSKEEIYKAVNILDGLVGYLVMYGYTVKSKSDHKEVLNEALSISQKLVEQELENLFSKSENYKFILKAVAYNMKTFSQIKEYINLHSGEISNQTLSNVLKSLVKYSYLEEHYENGFKTYVIPDPIVQFTMIKI